MKDTQELPSNLNPKVIAQKCPVCNGWGTVSFKRIVCHACEGKGYLVIPVDIERQKEHGRSSK